MKRTIAIFFFILNSLFGFAQEFNFQTQDLQLTVNAQGFVSDLSVCGKSIMAVDESPILVACRDGELLFPTRFEDMENQHFVVGFGESDSAEIEIGIHDNYLKIKIIEQSNFDAVIFTPLQVILIGSVGEITGVAQGNGIAFGIQALHPKAEAGLPSEYADKIKLHFQYRGEATYAAINTSKKTIMQFSARDRRQKQFRNVQGINEVMVMPLKGEEADIAGAAIALFGCRQDETLERIGAIETAEGMPHPCAFGPWEKSSNEATKSYLINDYTDKDAAFVQKKCHQGGLDMSHPVFANRIATNSSYVTPKPSKHLLRQGILRLHLGIAADQTHFAVYNSPLFDRPVHINIIQIGNELISYRTSELSGDIRLLYDCTRGIFGTKKTAHSENETVYKLWDHYDRTLVPDFTTQDSLSLVTAKRCSKTQFPLLIFNDLKSYAYNGHGDIALNHFLGTMFNNGNDGKRFQADQFTHYSWHYLTRVNENAVWNESMRTKMDETLPEKAEFYNRNFMPWMLGIFQIHPADKMRQATTMEELEWFLSKAAAYDAGFGLDFSVEAMRKHGMTDPMLDMVNMWESLRLADAFNIRQRKDMRDPYQDWHLEKANDSTYLLYPQYVSRRYLCNLNNDSWSWNNPYPSRFALRIAVEGKGSISELELRTPNGILYLPCTLKADQFLIYDFDGTARVTDQNYNTINEITPRGVSYLNEGLSEISFTCEVKTEQNKSPQVTIKYITQGDAEEIRIP